MKADFKCQHGSTQSKPTEWGTNTADGSDVLGKMFAVMFTQDGTVTALSINFSNTLLTHICT